MYSACPPVVLLCYMHHVTVSCDPPYSNSVGAGGGGLCCVVSFEESG